MSREARKYIAHIKAVVSVFIFLIAIEVRLQTFWPLTRTNLFTLLKEKKAAKSWLEGIPCIGISGIWCWLANKENRPNDEKILHPDFDLIPDLEQRAVIMVYDSDANYQLQT
jgi:hypothetical protein